MAPIRCFRCNRELRSPRHYCAIVWQEYYEGVRVEARGGGNAVLCAECLTETSVGRLLRSGTEADCSPQSSCYSPSESTS